MVSAKPEGFSDRRYSPESCMEVDGFNLRLSKNDATLGHRRPSSLWCENRRIQTPRTLQLCSLNVSFGTLAHRQPVPCFRGNV